MKDTLKFLMLEDNPSDARLILRELNKEWTNLVYKRVYSADDMQKNLYEDDWEIIISDYSMPQFTGLDGLEILKASGLDIPFIMVSGTMGEDIAVGVLKAGAHDYILKEKLHRLVPAIERELQENALRHEHKLTTEALDESLALSEAVIDGSPLGISVRDKFGRLLLYNKAWKKIWGYTDAGIEEQQRLRNELKFDNRDQYLSEFKEAVKEVYTEGKECIIPELKLKNRKNSKVEWVSQHFYALKKDRGRVEKVVVITEDISKRKASDDRQYLNSHILNILNKKRNWKSILDMIIEEIKETTHFDSIAIRLQKGLDYPYCSTYGFKADFIQKETSLLKKKPEEEQYNDQDMVELECLCGHVIRQDYDKSLPYFTAGGSFWCNDIDEFSDFVNVNEVDLLTRFTCVKAGYKSFAIVPLRAGNKIMGTLQFNNYQKDTFTNDLIRFFEEIGVTIGIAFQRIQSEEKLKESEKQFRSLYENSIMGIFRLSSEGRILMMNPCLLELLGYESLQEFRESKVSPALDFRRITRKLFNNINLDNNLIHKFEAGWKRRDGKDIFVRTSAKTIKNDKGEILFIDGSIEDRTDRMKAARALLESREMYRSLVEKANVGIVTDDKDGNITYFNSKFAELFGYTSEEMSELSYSDLFLRGDWEQVKINHKNRVSGKSAPLRYSLRGHRKDGSEVDVEIAVDQLLDENFNIIGTRAFVWDITERKQAQLVQKAIYEISSAVRSSENLNDLYVKLKDILSTVIDTTNIFVALYDQEKDELSLPFEVDQKDHHVSFPAGKSLTSYVIKKGKPMLLTEESINRLADKGEVEVIGTLSKIWLGAPLKTTKGTIGLISVQSYDNPLLYSERDLEILDFVSNEIALAIEKKRSEDNLKKTHEELLKLHAELEKKVENAVAELRDKDHIIIAQSRQAATGDMISRIAHHWRQPLNIIGVTIQSIQEAFEFGELTEEYMEEKTKITMDILQSLSKTIDDFRNFYQPEENTNTFDVRESIENTLYLIESQFSNSEIILERDIKDSAILKGSQNDFSQAFLNLITNAYDILLDRNVAKPQVFVSLKLTDDNAVICIRDNGGGIDDKIKEKLFELYTSTKKGLNNTGVGLYMSKSLIEKNLKGELTARNIEKGAEFKIILPRN